MADDEIRDRLRALPVFAGELPAFDPADAPAHPAELFAAWLLEAIDAGLREPHAMTLSTVDADGRPSARVLILKAVDDGRWQFASSRTSRKGEELAGSPWVAMTFWWSELGRQVRLRGKVLDAGPEAGLRDFLARPAGSQDPALADSWALYHLIPDEIEFFQGDADRDHVRLRYLLVAGAWKRDVLPA